MKDPPTTVPASLIALGKSSPEPPNVGISVAVPFLTMNPRCGFGSPVNPNFPSHHPGLSHVQRHAGDSSERPEIGDCALVVDDGVLRTGYRARPDDRSRVVQRPPELEPLEQNLPPLGEEERLIVSVSGPGVHENIATVVDVCRSRRLESSRSVEQDPTASFRPDKGVGSTRRISRQLQCPDDFPRFVDRICGAEGHSGRQVDERVGGWRAP